MAENKKKDIRYRRWCLTIWKSELIPDKKALATMLCKHKVKFLIIGDEFTKSEKPHFQCYVEYENGRSFNSLKRQFPNEGHFVEAKGTAQQNIDYCSKFDECPLKIGYANVIDTNLSKGDIASNLVDLMCSFDVDEYPPLFELIRDYPDCADYIVRNYNTLSRIYDDIQARAKQFHYKPVQQELTGIEIPIPEYLNF